MTPLALALLFCATAVAPLDWCAVAGRPGLDRLEELAKPLVLVLLVGAALVADAPSGDASAKALLVAGLVLSLVGDVALLPRVDRFVLGLVAFLLAHVAYVAAAVDLGLHPAWLAVGAVAVAVALSLLAPPVLRAVRAGDEPALAGPVLAYMGVISAMVVAAAGTGRPVLALGAALFYASDAQLAWDRFVSADRRLQLGCISTYHAGQALLLVGVVTA